MPHVLISDKLSAKAIEIFKNRNIFVHDCPGLGKDPPGLLSIIEKYDALIVRSATQVTSDLIHAGKKLKVIGRAGIGTDNIDVCAASRRGIPVINTPLGNSVTTAEFALALMFAVARELPAADFSTRQGKWEKAGFAGIEIAGKTLGIVGCGHVGSLLSLRALALGMHVLACDPFVSEERLRAVGAEKVVLDDLLARSDFVSLHTPLNDTTRNIINAEAIAKMKKSVRIINCARGGLIVEKDLAQALRAGKVAGAALDVFEIEPARENELFHLPNVICTPHLGASTVEAQENVAHEIAIRISDYLQEGIVANAINMPSVSANELSSLAPFLKLAEIMGKFQALVSQETCTDVEILFNSTLARMNTSLLIAFFLKGLLFQTDKVSAISAPFIAEEKGICVTRVHQEADVLEDSIQVQVKTPSNAYCVSGTCQPNGSIRISRINDMAFDSLVGKHMLYVVDQQKSHIIGFLEGICHAYGVNIRHFQRESDCPRRMSVALLSLDAPLPVAGEMKIQIDPDILFARYLHFHI